jgi:hypothetical protein
MQLSGGHAEDSFGLNCPGARSAERGDRRRAHEIIIGQPARLALWIVVGYILIMMETIVSFGVLFLCAFSRPVDSSPATRPGPSPDGIVVFLDRFGNTYCRGDWFDPDEAGPALGGEPTQVKRITLVFEPFSLETDRDRVQDILRKEFPGCSVGRRGAVPGDGYGIVRFPRHQPAVQHEVLSRRAMTWDQLWNGHRQWFGQIQGYLLAFAAQLARTRSDLSVVQQEYQYLTTRPLGTPSGHERRN